MDYELFRRCVSQVLLAGMALVLFTVSVITLFVLKDVNATLVLMIAQAAAFASRLML